jgi:NADPH-dependent 2,4-dienoyl-CoA reductase/sulfur reductase-like enzyme
MQEEGPLSLGFGRTAGEFFAGVLRDHGIDWVPNDALGRFEGDGRVQRVVTESGKSLDADLVVMGIGAVPDVMLARSAGLELGETGGIACSSILETSAFGVWAAGDACEYDSVVHGRRLRIEHWEVARAQGAAVATSIMGSREPFSEIPYFWSDLADWCTFEYVGPAESWDEEIVRGSVDDGEFTIFYRDDGRVVAALTVGRSDDLDRARELMTSGEVVSADEL